jgi:hypothetical protein
MAMGTSGEIEEADVGWQGGGEGEFLLSFDACAVSGVKEGAAQMASSQIPLYMFQLLFKILLNFLQPH